MDHRSESLQPQEIAPFVVLMVAALLVGLLLSIHGAQAAAPLTGGSSGQPAAAPASVSNPGTVLGSAHLDLNALTRADNIDESDNVRWSLVRGTPAAGQAASGTNSVDWAALRTVSAEGAFSLAPGASWSFNAVFGGDAGYKQASGVLAGGQCALATVFRAAAIKAGLPNKAVPHLYPIPGFPHSETVTIWWGTYDLTIDNPTAQAVSLAWKLTPDGVDVSVVQ